MIHLWFLSNRNLISKLEVNKFVDVVEIGRLGQQFDSAQVHQKHTAGARTMYKCIVDPGTWHDSLLFRYSMLLMGLYLVSTGDSKEQRRIGNMEVVRIGVSRSKIGRAHV